MPFFEDKDEIINRGINSRFVPEPIRRAKIIQAKGRRRTKKKSRKAGRRKTRK